ncbi:MAG: hypothetical protein OXI87_01365 [Albidovulum sp.]|nr:hypothetical protein [Albidovulum sp.]
MAMSFRAVARRPDLRRKLFERVEIMRYAIDIQVIVARLREYPGQGPAPSISQDREI